MEFEVAVTGEGDNSSPRLAVDYTDSRVIALAAHSAGPSPRCTLHVTRDSGRTWQRMEPVTERQRVPGSDGCSAADVAFDITGTLHYLFTAVAGGAGQPAGMFLMSSSDRGRTWSAPREVAPAGAFGGRVALDPTFGPRGRLHIVWVQASTPPAPEPTGLDPPPNPLFVVQSDDGGHTFSARMEIGEPGRRMVSPTLGIGIRGAIHVAYFDMGDDGVAYAGGRGVTWPGRWSVKVATSRDGGKRYNRPVEVAGVERPPPFSSVLALAPPALAAHRDSVCAGWADARLGDPDVYVRCSVNAGRTWFPPRRLNQATGDGRSQFLPGLSLTSRGRLDVAYYERQADPLGAHTDVFLASSVDVGQRFGAEHRLTARSFEAMGRDLGSSPAVIERGNNVLTAWTATGDGRQHVFVASAVAPVDDRRTTTNPLLIPAFLLLGVIVFAVVRGRRRALEDERQAVGGEGSAPRSIVPS